MVEFVERLKIDFTQMITTEIHKKAIKTSTTYSFPYVIFQLCTDAGVPIWPYDRLCKQTFTPDIGLIKDEANIATPHKGPRIEVPPLSDNMVYTVELAQGETLPQEPYDPTQASSSHAPSSSRSTPPFTLLIL